MGALIGASGVERLCALCAVRRGCRPLSFTVRWQRVTSREIQERAFA
jgi:hypothetical protein